MNRTSCALLALTAFLIGFMVGIVGGYDARHTVIHEHKVVENGR